LKYCALPIVNVPDRPLFGVPLRGRILERDLAVSRMAALTAAAAAKKVARGQGYNAD
jgi:hypothetical protein